MSGLYEQETKKVCQDYMYQTPQAIINAIVSLTVSEELAKSMNIINVLMMIKITFRGCVKMLWTSVCSTRITANTKWLEKS